MAFQPNIPQPTDQISQSQQDLLDNFTEINTFLNVNHVAFNGPDQGKHKFLTFPVQAMAPVFAAGEVGMYNALFAGTGVNELFITNQAGTSTPATASSQVASGYTYLPSGIIMMWGIAALPAAGANNIVFPTGFPNNNFSVQATIRSAAIPAGPITVFNPITTGFICVSPAAGLSIFYLAIGN